MKKVYCIYRDLPELHVNVTEQQAFCRALANHLNFEISQEFFDGDMRTKDFDISIPNSLHIIHDDAQSRKFDALLAYSTKCIGREEVETPFMINYLIACGVEVHSVIEGEQKTHELAYRISKLASAF